VVRIAYDTLGHSIGPRLGRRVGLLG